MTMPPRRSSADRDIEVVVVDLASLPDGGLATVADATILLARVDGQVRAYRNACPHRGTRLDAGVVRNDVVTCPAHLWRFSLDDGACRNADARLDAVACEVRDGQVHVEVPDDASAPAGSLRAALLAHARSWDRDAAAPAGGATAVPAGDATASATTEQRRTVP